MHKRQSSFSCSLGGWGLEGGIHAMSELLPVVPRRVVGGGEGWVSRILELPQTHTL